MQSGVTPKDYELYFTAVLQKRAEGKPVTNDIATLVAFAQRTYNITPPPATSDKKPSESSLRKRAPFSLGVQPREIAQTADESSPLLTSSVTLEVR